MAETKLRTFAFSAKKKEANYGTGVVGDLDSVIGLDETVFVNPDFMVEPDTFKLSGAAEPTSVRMVGKKWRASLAMQWASPHFLAMIAAFAFGSPQKAGAQFANKGTVTKPTNYKVHEFTTIQTRPRPTFVMKELVDDATDDGDLYTGVGVESFSISGSIGEDRIIRASADVVAGKMSDSDTAISSTEPDDGVLDGAGAKVYLTEGTYTPIDVKTGSNDSDPFSTASEIGSSDDITSDVHSFEYSYGIQPNLSNAYVFGSGQDLGKWERGKTPSHSLRLDFKWSEAEMARYADLDDLAFQISIPGKALKGSGANIFYSGATLVIPKMTYSGYTRQDVDGEMVLSANFMPHWGAGATDQESAYLYVWNTFEKYAGT